MKYSFFALFLIVSLFSLEVKAQDFVIMQVTEVDQPPVYEGCTKEDFNCSLNQISSFLIKNMDPQVLLKIKKEEDAVINLKIILGEKGDIKRVTAQGSSEELKAEAVRIASSLSDFEPASHNGKAVNVIIDLPLKLESRDPLPFSSSSYDTPAIAKSCKGEEDPRRCTSLMVQNFMNRNMRTSKLKTEEEFISVIFDFIIDENGRPSEILVTSTNESLKAEGIRTINKLPDFIPATKDGKYIPVSYKLPMTISIQRF